MEPERWQQVESLYHSALEVAEGDRAAFLERSCAGDESLRREVESLLAHDTAAENFIESPALEVAGRLFARDLVVSIDNVSADGDSRSIGPYSLMQKIGEGGMGEVWLAQQTSPVRRQVALKLIRSGINSHEITTRFESERQALALMDHPAVAKVFDGGCTASGRPFFVMEYVSGVSITEWCDNHKLSVRERLELFIQVCMGVQHAHQKAVIHRDLKPSNVLVTEVDGKATPKIIDFGVAKAVSQKLTEETLVTRVGAILGTPEYMSPEQAASAGEDIDTRTDVYSLGVILYELLVGAPPLDLKRLTLEEALRTLRQDEPQRPSTRVRLSGERSAAVYQSRLTEPKTLGRQLRGDLDSIVMKALEKQRARRYGGPSELAADIGRYLRLEPVLARPASAGYRTGKYVLRHRVSVGFGLVVFGLLGAFVVTQTIQFQRIKRERDRADRIAGYMTGMFKVSDPSEARGNNITAREILDKASNEIKSSLARDPELLAQMTQVMSTVYLNLGLFSRAESLARETSQIRHRLLGPHHPDTLHSDVDVGIMVFEQGRYDEAIRILKPAIDTMRRVLGPNHPDTLRAQVNLAAALSEQGHTDDAEKLLRPTVEGLRQALGPDDIATLKAMTNLALALRPSHRYAEQEALDRQVTEIARRTLGPDHPYTLQIMAQLARLLDDQGRYAEEEPLVRQSLEIERRVLGDDHAQTLISMNNLATILMHKAQYAEAEAEFRSVREVQRRVLGPDHPNTAISTYNLACIATYQGDYSAALQLLREAVDHGLNRTDAAGIKDDPDLRPLHTDPRFAALLAYVRQRGR